ncbi:ATP-dependent protease, putative [Plasmodium ovale]|uniref:ATP-dependent protease, putative n=1 Tax=Plasmodium ovale TaxID=36330 RepID=A0A1C3KXG1_PLAOA|nr:ATP-dependent protease, putative [Plasmodium ovale]
MLPLLAIIRCGKKELFRIGRNFYRSSNVSSKHNEVQSLKEICCFCLLNKPLFPGLSYVLNADRSIIKILEDKKKRSKTCKKTYVGLFFNRKAENDLTYDLFSDADFGGNFFSSNKRYEDKNGKEKDLNRWFQIVRKDIDYITDLGDIYEYGCIGMIKHIVCDESEEGTGSGRITGSSAPCIRLQGGEEELRHIGRITVEILEKVKMKRWKGKNIAEIDIVYNNNKYEMDKDSRKKIKIYQIEIVEKIKELINMNSKNSYEYKYILNNYNIKNINNLINFIGNITINKNSNVQKLFEITDLEDKLIKCIELLNEDIYLFKIKNEIINNLNNKFLKDKKELFLNEYINTLKKKIGQKTDHEIIYDTFLKKFNLIKYYLKDDSIFTISREIDKFVLYNENCNEYSSTYQYLNTVLNIPFGKYAHLNDDIYSCEKTLDNCHYGLNEVKNYIIEFLSLYILNRNIKPKSLLLVGYPGVGKTSICKSISLSLNIPYYVINMNNIHNMNELIGHRKTYVNSYEGKIVNSLITTKVMNPLILLDEFDKIAFVNTNIYNTLLNIFDTKQNTYFMDQYVNFPIDISNAFFVCTANSIDNIPDVLLDRMEIIYVYPYTNAEKCLIFKNYIKRKIQEETSVTNDHLVISDAMILYIIQNYTNENGVRQLYNVFYSIYRRRAYMLLKGVTKKVELNENDIHELNNFVNLECIKWKRGNAHALPSIAGSTKSLAFTDNGGQIVTIEVCGLMSRYLVNCESSGLEAFSPNDNNTHPYRSNTPQSHLNRNSTIKNATTHLSNRYGTKMGRSANDDLEKFHDNTIYTHECEKKKLGYNHIIEEESYNKNIAMGNEWHKLHLEPDYNCVSKKRYSFVKDLNEFPSVSEDELNDSNLGVHPYGKTSALPTGESTMHNWPTLQRGKPVRETDSTRNVQFTPRLDLHEERKRKNMQCNIIITGNVGKVMQESIIIANTYSINLLSSRIPNFEAEYLHINLSECDIKKDGPSAGINFVTAIISYYLNIPVDNSLCMTGEITLNGYIQKIGGLMEKVIVAKNFGIRKLMIPRDNVQEYELLPNYVKEDIQVSYVHHYYEIFNSLFTNVGRGP